MRNDLFFIMSIILLVVMVMVMMMVTMVEVVEVVEEMVTTMGASYEVQVRMPQARRQGPVKPQSMASSPVITATFARRFT